MLHLNRYSPLQHLTAFQKLPLKHYTGREAWIKWPHYSCKTNIVSAGNRYSPKKNAMKVIFCPVTNRENLQLHSPSVRKVQIGNGWWRQQPERPAVGGACLPAGRSSPPTRSKAVRQLYIHYRVTNWNQLMLLNSCFLRQHDKQW